MLSFMFEDWINNKRNLAAATSDEKKILFVISLGFFKIMSAI